MESFSKWWWPAMGAVLLLWGVFVRTQLVKTWPQDVAGDARFVFEKLFYIVDAAVFYAAILMMSEVSNGWISLVMCVAATVWAIVVQDRTLILRLPVLFLTSFVLIEVKLLSETTFVCELMALLSGIWWLQVWNDEAIGTFSFFATSLACTIMSGIMILVLSVSNASGGQPDTEVSVTAPDGLIDVMLLCGFAIAFADQKVTHGGLALGWSVAALPALYLRRYPTLLPLVPILVPLSLFFFLGQQNTHVDIGAEDVLGLISLSGATIAGLLGVMSLVQVCASLITLGFYSLVAHLSRTMPAE